MSRVLFVDKDYLTVNSVINDNMDFNTLRPIIFLVQELNIRELLGTNLFNLISSEISTNTVSTDNKYLLDNYILPAMVCYINAEGLTSFKWKFLNKGILEKSADNATQISTSDLQYLKEDWLRKATAYGQLMINYIRQNQSLYPTYFNNTGLDHVKPSGNAFKCSIYIPDSYVSIKAQPSDNDKYLY